MRIPISLRKAWKDTTVTKGVSADSFYMKEMKKKRRLADSVKGKAKSEKPGREQVCISVSIYVHLCVWVAK